MKIKSFALFVAVLAVHLIVGGVTWVVTRQAGEHAAGEAQDVEQVQGQEAEPGSNEVQNQKPTQLKVVIAYQL